MLIMRNSLLLVFVFASVLMACDNVSEKNSRHSQEQSDSEITYICPMDCEDGKTYEEDGECPVCGMGLDESEED